MSVTEQEFAQTLSLIDNEVESAFIVFHSYEELNRLAITDKDILRILNEDAMFWGGYRATLLTSLFMTMSRLFDPASDATTVQTLVTAVLGNLQLFSKSSLGARKMGYGPKPDWHDDFMAEVWIPTECSQLRHLKKALSPHVTRFTKIYLPIRNNIYAHRLLSDEKASTDLFPSTNRNDLSHTLDFLQDLVLVIRNLYDNGREPVLGNANLIPRKAQIRHSVEKVLRKLLNASNALTLTPPRR